MKTDGEIINECLKIIPFGNIKTHTKENLPDKVQYLVDLAYPKKYLLGNDGLELTNVCDGTGFLVKNIHGVELFISSETLDKMIELRES